MPDADPARVVVLDPTGTMVAANAAWRLDNLPSPQPFVAGTLNAFDRLVRAGGTGPLRAAELVSELLDGERDEVTLEYRSLESEFQRSTTLRVYPWVHQGERWAVLRQEDTSALARAQELAAAMTGIVDDLPVAAIVCDLAHRVQFWNAAAQQLYGYTAEQVAGRPLEQLITIGGSAEELGAERLDDSGRASLRQLHRRLDGTTVEVDLAIRLRPGHDGLPALLAFTATRVAPMTD